MIKVREELCDFCGTCVSVCPHDALELFESRLVVDEKKCTLCMMCEKVCPVNAIWEDPK